MFKNIVLGAGVLAALLAVLIFSGRIPIPGRSTAVVASGTVVMWGTLPQGDIEPILQKLNTEVRTYRVDYQEIPETQFSAKLLNALASGTGPDMILTPYQIILEHRDRIYPFPIGTLSAEQYKNFYADGTRILLNEAGALALPVSIEPLMLFYNRALFSKHAVINPPTTWDEVSGKTPALTVNDTNGQFKESAIALGTYNNIDTAKDILMTLVAQLGQVPVDRQAVSGKEVFSVTANDPLTTNVEVEPLTTSLRFFTEFSNPAKVTYTWNTLQPRALDQFAAEKLAMYIGYYGDLKLLLAKNSRLDIGMTMLPQAKGYPTVATGMRLYGIATLKRSGNSYAALSAQSALAGDAYGSLIAESLGGVSPLRSVIASKVIDLSLRQSVLVARGWYDINPLTSGQYMQSMVGDVTSGRSTISEAVALFVSRLSDLYTH